VPIIRLFLHSFDFISYALQVQETNWFTRSARQVMNKMHLRAVRHKACLILIIGFLLVLIGIVFNYGVLARYHKKNRE
jgi:hypothetical protein